MSKEALQEYFKRYIVDIRGRKLSTYKHYIDALNNISRNLVAKGKIVESIYEISSIAELEECQKLLLADGDFVAMDERGNRMYTAGFNNYMRFAEGMGFPVSKADVAKFDVPVPKPLKVSETIEKYKRSNIVRIQAIQLAGHKCEIDNSHITFTKENDHNPYMEGHHAIPLHLQEQFAYSLDVYANVVCLCPICHRKIHYACRSDKIDMLDYLYGERRYRLENCGIKISKDEFIKDGLRR